MSYQDPDQSKTNKWKLDSAPFVPSGASGSKKMANLAGSASYIPNYTPSSATEYVPSTQQHESTIEDNRPSQGPRYGKNSSQSSHGIKSSNYGQSQNKRGSNTHEHGSNSQSNNHQSGGHHGHNHGHNHHHHGHYQHFNDSSKPSWTPSSKHAGPLSSNNPASKGPHQFFMAEQLRRELLNRTVLCLRGSNPEDPQSAHLPRVVHRYHSLYPLEDQSKDKLSKVFGVPSFVFKATDGVSYYALRKIDQVRVNDLSNPAIEAWKSLIHPQIVPIREIFISSAFNNTSSIFIAYEYLPGAETLEQRFPGAGLSQVKPPGFQGEPKGLNEDLLWSFLIQLVSAIRAIHSKGLSASKLINPSKIIVVGKNRLRLSSVGLEDLFKYDNRKPIVQAKQQEDITCLGQLILRLASPLPDFSFAAVQKALETVAASFSSEFHSVLLRLLGLIPKSASSSSSSSVSSSKVTEPFGNYPTIEEIQHMLTSRAFIHIERVYAHCDALESELCKELDNGRLFRLMVKLGFINERPEFDFAVSWSETGDRFPLKLFRDYVFHQVDEEGNPVLDVSHVIECLNKLEAGVDERVLLMSRDEKSMLVLKYKDLKRYLTDSFNELFQKQSNQKY